MSEELTKEEQAEEEEKAIAWLRGQRIARKQFNKKAFEMNQTEYHAQEEADKMADIIESINRAVQEAGKIEKRQVRRMSDERKQQKS